MPSLKKPAAANECPPMMLSCKWDGPRCFFMVSLLNYQWQHRVKYGALFRTLDQYGTPVGTSAWAVHGVFWKPLRTALRQYRSMLIDTGLDDFKEWLKASVVVPALDLPPNVAHHLRPYQKAGARRLANGTLLLGDCMGLGKTLQMLTALAMRGDRALVVVPNDTVAAEWIAQQEKFGFTFRTEVLNRTNYSNSRGGDLRLITYAKLRRPEYLRELLAWVQTQQAGLILDEGHRAGRVSSQQHKACYQISREAKWVWVSSGTEVSGTPDDYYGIFRLVAPTHVGVVNLLHEDRWLNYFRAKGRKVWEEERLEKDLRLIRYAYGLRRTKEQVCKELPPFTEVDIPCIMDPLQCSQYHQMREELEVQVRTEFGDVDLDEHHFFTVYLRLMQLAAHPMLLGETRIDLTPKTERLLELVEDAGSQSVLVWSNWPKVIEWLAQLITNRGISCAGVHGGTSPKQRELAREQFQAGRIKVLVANPGVWGEGVNLQKASIMIDHDYHPGLARWRQSRSRAHRIGQTLPVTSYRIYHSGTIERTVLDWLEEKGRLSTLITGG